MGPSLFAWWVPNSQANGYNIGRDTFGSRHTKQLGTLGGGNHFVELVYDEEASRREALLLFVIS